MAKAATRWLTESGYGDVTGTSPLYLVDENGNNLITQDGDYLVTSGTEVTPKDDTDWDGESKTSSWWAVGSGYGDVLFLEETERLMEDGTVRVLEDGTERVLEDSSYRAKDATEWEED